MGKVWGEAWLGTWVWTFCFFLVFPLFFAVWPKPRENQKKTKKQKVQTHGQGLGRGLAGDMGLNFCFFGFSMVFCNLAKTSRKQKKQKVQTHGQGLGRGLAGDMGLNFLVFFVFVVFPWFFAVWPKPRENKKKKSDPWARSGERPGWGHGSELFPECVARVPVSLWGSWGWGCVRSTLRSRSQPSATVRNRPQPSARGPYGRAYGKFCRSGFFGGFRRVVASFRVAGVCRRGTSWHSDVFWNVSKVVLRGRRNTFATFSEDVLHFRGRRSTLDVSIVIFRGRRSTLDVSCCVFFVNRIGRAVSSGDKVQIPWHAWHFVTCTENWRKPRTKHRFWGCKFSGSKENS